MNASRSEDTNVRGIKTVADTQGTQTVPNPPTGDPNTDISGAGNGSGMDQFRGLISRLAGGGTPAINQALERHHQEVMANAIQKSQDAKTYYNLYHKYQVGQTNPQTGKPITPEEYNEWKRRADNAYAEYSKIAGQAKAAKPLIQQVGGVLQHLDKFTKQRQQTVQGPPQPQQSTVPPNPGSENPFERAAERDVIGQQVAEQDKETADARIKDTEYRNRLAADADPKYHTNQIAQLRDDVQKAFPDMKPEDVENAVLTKAGVIPKAAGHEMQPDFKDGMLVGVKSPLDGKYYTDPDKMPPEAKAIYDSAKKVEKEHQDEQERREKARLQNSLQLQVSALQMAFNREDYKDAKKIVDSANNDYNAALDRQDTMHKNLDAALGGDQQAMLSLVANHIGMTLGAQKGARISRAVWEEAAASAPWWDTKVAKFFHDDPQTGEKVFDGWKSGVTLAPEQIKQMVRLGDEKVDTLKKHVDRVEQENSDALSQNKRKKADTRGKVSGPPTGNRRTIDLTK